MNEFIRKLNEYHLCTWYILPLLDLNIDSFGRAAFMNSYLVRDEMQLVVQVADQNLCLDVQEHPCYRRSYENNGTDFLIFDIPDGWRADFQKYIKGAYSKFTHFTKCKIREKSGLTYRISDEKGRKVTDAILLALDQDPVLRAKWMEILGHDVELPEELLSKPKPESFIEIAALDADVPLLTPTEEFLDFAIVDPYFPSDCRYVMGIDEGGKLRERVLAAIWKFYPDGSFERVKYSDDIPKGDGTDEPY